MDIGGKALRRGRRRRARDSVMAQQAQSHAQSPVVSVARLVKWMEDCTHERCGGCGGARIMYAGTKVTCSTVDNSWTHVWRDHSGNIVPGAASGYPPDYSGQWTLMK